MSVYWERRQSGLSLQGSNDLRRWWTGMDYGGYFNTSRILSIFRCKNGRIDYPDTPGRQGSKAWWEEKSICKCKDYSKRVRLLSETCLVCETLMRASSCDMKPVICYAGRRSGVLSSGSECNGQPRGSDASA